MKVVHMVPGTGGTYFCQNCLRDSLVVPALQRLGIDVILVPMYLPAVTDEVTQPRNVPVFFGAINVYLQEKLALFRRTPRWLDSLLDGRGLLEFVARKTASTSARGLEEMTLSMLAGKDGRQAKELRRLVEWLKSEIKPEIVHLSNALLLGLAPELKAELDCLVVCSLQDEDTWVDAMSGDYPQRVYETMRRVVPVVDSFVAVSRYYGDKMAGLLSIPPERLEVIPIGIPLEVYAEGELPFDPPVIGFISRLAESLGLGILVDAFVQLKSMPRFSRLKLRAMGGMTRSDRRFIAAVQRRLRRAGFEGDAEFIEEFDRESRARFLRGVTVLSVPVPGGEAFGMYILEALACGVPVVQPRAGAFPEIVEATGGGVIYDPGEEDALRRALGALLDDPERLRSMGERGREVVRERFGIDAIAARLGEHYGRVLGNAGREASGQ